MMKPRSLALVTGSMLCLIGAAQQIPDSAFTYQSKTPAYPKGTGPVVVLDEAHFNFHTLGGRYHAFGKVLGNDGYQMRPGTQKFTLRYLEEARILVISNALPDESSWQLPTSGAFTKEENEAVKNWVYNGGSLLLIADHMPFAGAAAGLARSFGVNWINGYAVRKDRAPEFFARKAGNLTTNPITDGGGALERIDSIQTFTGSAFLVPPEAIPITRMRDDYEILLPTIAGQFNDSTAHVDGAYFINGAMLPFGNGRVVIFGEAAMFSAQLQGPERRHMGMNQPGSEQNPQLLLNVIHWLDRRL
ncbi:MAG: hypothetical protein IPK99_17165 [Flavobacteriales bacterium]|nr:hypothetical protein [Flavobacteriales bacterium]